MPLLALHDASQKPVYELSCCIEGLRAVPQQIIREHLLYRARLRLHQRQLLTSAPSAPRRGLTQSRAFRPQVSAMEGTKQGLAAHWPAACAGLAGVYCLYKLFLFVRADADLRLLSRRSPPKEAFADKVVWITGASQGLGEELAKQFAAKGAFLILSSRNAERLEAVKAGCVGRHAPSEVKVLPLDVTASEEKLQKAAAQADSAFDGRGIDILVHNAGASQRSPVEETSAEVLDSLFELNVIGTLKLTQAVLPKLLLRAKHGHTCRLVIVGSQAGHMPAAGQAVYAACKASVAAYFQSLHSELWSRGVKVTLCQPGPIATGVQGQVRSLYGSKGLLTESTESDAELRKRHNPKRVAELILRAAYHGLDSCWIAKHPVLLLAYVIQYLPALGFWALNSIGPSRVAAYRAGKSGYDTSMLQKGADR